MTGPRWVVQCQVEYSDGRWKGSRQVPTFYLNPDGVGTDRNLIDRIIRDIVDPLGKADRVHISAELL